MLYVLLESHAFHTVVTTRSAVFVQEVGIIQVGLELTDISVVFVNAAFVGSRFRTFISSGPFAEHAGGISVALEYLGNDDMVRIIRMLAHS